MRSEGRCCFDPPNPNACLDSFVRTAVDGMRSFDGAARQRAALANKAWNAAAWSDAAWSSVAWSDECSASELGLAGELRPESSERVT
jgi:hypothetical protein